MDQNHPPHSYLQKVSQEQDMEKEFNVEYASFRSQPSMRTNEATVGKQNAQQYKHLKEYFRKDLKEMAHEQFENSEVILYSKEELPPDDSRRVKHIKVIATTSGSTTFYCKIQEDSLQYCGCSRPSIPKTLP